MIRAHRTLLLTFGQARQFLAVMAGVAGLLERNARFREDDSRHSAERIDGGQ